MRISQITPVAESGDVLLGALSAAGATGVANVQEEFSAVGVESSSEPKPQITAAKEPVAAFFEALPAVGPTGVANVQEEFSTATEPSTLSINPSIEPKPTKETGPEQPSKAMLAGEEPQTQKESQKVDGAAPESLKTTASPNVEEPSVEPSKVEGPAVEPPKTEGAPPKADGEPSTKAESLEKAAEDPSGLQKLIPDGLMDLAPKIQDVDQGLPMCAKYTIAAVSFAVAAAAIAVIVVYALKCGKQPKEEGKNETETTSPGHPAPGHPSSGHPSPGHPTSGHPVTSKP